MSLLFGKLAEVELLHDYFTDGRAQGLRAVAAPDAEGAMQNAGVAWRMIGHKLVLLAKTKSDGTLRRPMAPGAAFRFYLLPASDNFLTISNLSVETGGSQRYFFSNRSGVVEDGSLFLTQSIAAYDAGRPYVPGNLVRSGANLFEAVRPSGGSGPAHGLGEAEWWMSKAAGQYANGADLTEFTGATYAFPVAPAAASVTTAVWGEEAATGAFDVPVRTARTVAWGDAQSIANVSLAGLSAGRYRIEVNGASRIVYFDEEAVARKVFAVIEIGTALPESHAHGLFSADGTLRSPRYALRIAARSVHWKYIARTDDVQDILDRSETVSARHHFDLASPLQFLSSRPIPLREAPLTTLALDSARLGEVAPIASASPYNLGTCTVEGDILLCSEIRLNY